jgi:hypothetical protein
MAKIKITSNPRVKEIFDDLDKYRDFCVEYGYKFDESTLYDMRHYIYRAFNKYSSGKYVKDNWVEDSKV